MGRADRRSPSTSTPSSLPRRRGRREYLLCWLMASGRFGCHDISRHRWGGSAGWEGCCFGLLEGAGPVTVVADGVVWVHCTRGGCYWSRVGGTEGRWGLRAVRTTLGQWFPTLVEQADSRRLGAGRLRTMTTGTLRRRRSGGGGGGPVTEAPGCAARTPDSLPRGPVSTALTLTSLPSVRPAGIVEILRFFFGVRRRYAFNVSTMDTSDLPGPARPLAFDLALASRTISPPKAPARASASEVMTPICLRSQETAHQETAQT